MMKLFFLTCVTMIAFAANSLLNRAALTGNAIGPGEFAALRLASGAVMLLILLSLREKTWARPQPIHIPAVLGLAAYMLGFSFAYVSLDAGLGALILFGGVQLTMFAGSVAGGERAALSKWLGMLVSLSGLVLLFWPTDQVVLDGWALGLMGVAAVGWGIYSLIGRGITDPLGATAWNFVYALPLSLLGLFFFASTDEMTAAGVGLAILSGALTSGLGYALWYKILPELGAMVGALAQLSVPVIALVLGVMILGEAVTLKSLIACMLVLGGIGLGVLGGRALKSRG